MIERVWREDVEGAAAWLLDAALRRGAAQADLLWTWGVRNSFSLCDGEPEEDRMGSGQGLGLRLLDGAGRQGVAFVNSLDRHRLEHLLQWSLHNCRQAEVLEGLGLYGGPAADEVDLELEDPRIMALTASERHELCRSMDGRARDCDPRIVAVRSASWDDGWGEGFYASTEGLSFWHRATFAACGVSVVLEEGETVEMGGSGGESRSLKGLDPLFHAREAVEKTALVLGGKSLPTGRYPLVLDAEVTADFVDLLGELFLASNVRRKSSLLAERMGDAVAASCLTLVDDGRIPGGMGSSLVDGEGVPTGRTTLLEGGRVLSFLYDLRHARLEGRASTGNGARGVGTLPDVGTNNLFFLPGTASTEDLLKAAEGGIFVTEIMGLHTVDTVSGEFSLGIKGALIRSGHPAEPVAGVTMAGSILDLLAGVKALGKELRFFGTTGGSALAVDDMAIAGL